MTQTNARTVLPPASEHDAITRELRRLVKDRRAARAAAEGGPSTDAALWRALVEGGYAAGGLSESHGGTGLGLAEMSAIAETLGYFVAPVPFVAVCAATRVLNQGDGEAAAALAAELVAGRSVGVGLSARHGAPRELQCRPQVTNRGADRASLSGEIHEAFDTSGLEVLLIPADGAWWALRVDAAGVSREEIRSLDASRPLARITLHEAQAQRVADGDPEEIVRIAWVLLAAQATGIAQAALDLSRDYALLRQQFGQPIGRFQAIKHKLADSLLAVENARSSVWGAVRSAIDGVPTPREARTAKATATAAAVRVAVDAIQLHGAIGNTWDLDLHLLLRRAKGCELSLGTPDAHMDALAEDLIDTSADSRSALASHNRKAESTEAIAGFRLEDADREFIAEFREWLDRNATPEIVAGFRAKDTLKKRRALRDWQARMADAGWAGIHWPKEYNGREASFSQQVLYHTEIAVRNLPRLIGNRGLSQIGPTLIAHGTAEQKRKYVEATRRADILWASGLSERGSGSDLASLRTRAVVDGDELVINGHKIWTTSAHFSDYIYTLVRTGPLVPKHRGISCVIVPANAPGLTIQPIRRITGIADFNECLFDNVRIPRSNLIGPLNEGWRVMRTTLSHEHMTNFLGAQFKQAVTVDRLIERLRQRQQGEIANHGLRRRVIQAWVNAQLLRMHGLRNVVQLAAGQEPGASGSILKLFGQEEEKRLWELAIDVMDSQGLVWDKWALGFLSSRGSTVGGGTSEIHRNKVAERVLGMPRDLWADDADAGQADL